MNTKTLIAGVAALGLVSCGAYAQGTIAFANNSSSLVTINGTAATTTQGVKIALFYQPNTGGSAPAPLTTANLSSGSTGSWEAFSSIASITPAPPNVGTFTVAETTGNDVAPGGNVWLEAIAWNGSYTTFSAASQGSSAPGFIAGFTTVWSQGTGGAGTPPSTAVPTAGNFGAIALTPVPEPTTIALAGLGAASLLLFRRRK